MVSCPSHTRHIIDINIAELRNKMKARPKISAIKLVTVA